MILNTYNHRKYYCYIYGNGCHNDDNCTINHLPSPTSDYSSEEDISLIVASEWPKYYQDPSVKDKANQSKKDDGHNWIDYLLCKKYKLDYLKEDNLEEQINKQFLKCSAESCRKEDVCNEKATSNDTDVKEKKILLITYNNDTQHTKTEIYMKKNERPKLCKQNKIWTDEFNDGYVQGDPSPCKPPNPTGNCSDKTRSKNLHSLINKSESNLNNFDISTDPSSSTSANNDPPNDLLNKFNLLRKLKESLNGEIPCNLLFKEFA